MSIRRFIANSILPASLLRKETSKLVEDAWAETVPGPFDPLKESDLMSGSEPSYERFALTIPMGLSSR